MKIVLGLFGLLVILIGSWPFLIDMEFIPELLKSIPSSGVYYQSIIIFVGALAVLIGLKNKKHKKEAIV